MKRNVSATLIVFVLSLLISGQSAASPSAGSNKSEQEILKLINDWIDALKRNDGPALERMFADDFHIIESDGALRDKEQELRSVKSGEIKFEKLSVEDVKVFISGDTAIATGITMYRGTFKGKAFEDRERFFDVFQKRNGKWKILASRPTPLKTPAATNPG